MAEINIDCAVYGNYYGVNVNLLKKYSDTYIYVILGMSIKDNTPTEIIAVESYPDVKKAIEKSKLSEFSDYMLLLWVKPHDPKAFPVDMESEMAVWVMGDITYSNIYKKYQSTHQAAAYLEKLANDYNVYGVANHDLDDLIVLIGKEIQWPEQNMYKNNWGML